MEKRKNLVQAKGDSKASELANEENEGVFESNRKSQDEGYSTLNYSTFHNGAQAVRPEAVRHASRLTDGARKFRRWRYYRPTRPPLEGPSRLTRPDSQVYVNVRTFNFSTCMWITDAPGKACNSTWKTALSNFFEILMWWCIVVKLHECAVYSGRVFFFYSRVWVMFTCLKLGRVQPVYSIHAPSWMCSVLFVGVTEMKVWRLSQCLCCLWCPVLIFVFYWVCTLHLTYKMACFSRFQKVLFLRTTQPRVKGKADHGWMGVGGALISLSLAVSQ